MTGNICRHLAGLLALVIAFSASIAAQTGDVSKPGFGNGARAKPLPAGGPAPRASDGHPDLSGVWFPGFMGTEDLTAESDPASKQFDPKITPEEKPPFQPWAAAKVKGMSQVELEIGRSSVNCMPRGVPGMFLANPYPIQLVETSGQLIQLDELNNNWRVIPTDGRPHTENPDPTFNGEDVGRWDGDTLLIDDVALDERTWNNLAGWFHSDQEHVVEHLSRPNMNYLIYQATIEDPKVLTKAWTSAPRHWSLAHEPLQEYYCTNNEDKRQFEELEEKAQKEKAAKR